MDTRPEKWPPPNLLRERKINSTTSQLTPSDGHTVNTTVDILNATKDYYQKLFAREKNNSEKQEQMFQKSSNVYEKRTKNFL